LSLTPTCHCQNVIKVNDTMPGLNLADDLDVLPPGLIQHLADEPVKQKLAVQGQYKGSTMAVQGQYNSREVGNDPPPLTAIHPPVSMVDRHRLLRTATVRRRDVPFDNTRILYAVMWQVASHNQADLTSSAFCTKEAAMKSILCLAANCCTSSTSLGPSTGRSTSTPAATKQMMVVGGSKEMFMQTDSSR